MVNEDHKADKTAEESDIDHINKVITSSESPKDHKPIEAEEIHRIDESVPEATGLGPVAKEHDATHSVKSPEHEHKHADIKKAEQEHKDHKITAHKAVNPQSQHHSQPKHVAPIKSPAVKKHGHVSHSIPSKDKLDKTIIHKKIVHKPTPAKITVKDSSKGGKINSMKKPFKRDKMASHKEHEHHKDNKKKSRFNRNTLMWVGIGVLAAILVISLVLILSPSMRGNSLNNQTVKSVAATVNGEPIYLQDVVKAYNDLNPLLKSSYSVESMLNRSIDELLLYQEAKSRGMSASAEEIQSEIDGIKTQNNLDDASLEAELEKQGLTIDAVKDIIEKNIRIRKLLNATILNNISVTQGQIQTYYLQNTDKFKVPEKVTIQHILIQVGPNVTENQSKAKIEQVKSELTDTNFCELVTIYSDDLGSKSNCGIYTFAKGDFNNPEFENPSFDLNINETAIVKTVFGYHLIKKLDSIPAKIQDISEVSAAINKTLYDQGAQDNFESLLAELKSRAVIVNYITKTDNTNEQVDTSNTSSEPVQANLDDFAKCITNNGAVFYGAYWCPHCNNQKELFGESLQYINYVECAVEGQPQVQTKACTDAGISGYPTWIINGKSYPGEQTLSSLAKSTGCKAP